MHHTDCLEITFAIYIYLYVGTNKNSNIRTIRCFQTKAFYVSKLFRKYFHIINDIET